MKKIIISSFAGLTLLALLAGTAVLALANKKRDNHFWRGPLMSMEEVCKTWGSAPLNVAQFKEAGMKESVFHSQYHLFTEKENEDRRPPSAEPLRAKMACSLLKNQKKFYGKDTREIRRTFGDYTGRYFSDTIPTYIIGKKKPQDESIWQLVFFRNRHAKIIEIVVHQNCCDD